jgi:hypothetical protein
MGELAKEYYDKNRKVESMVEGLMNAINYVMK